MDPFRIFRFWRSWRKWAPNIRQRFGCVWWEKVVLRRRLKVVTGCSGTDSPVKALHSLVGPSNVDHIASYESDPFARDFIKAHFSPQHMFTDVAALHDGSEKRCLDHPKPEGDDHDDHHDAGCATASNGVDIFVAGFPCTPFSVYNINQFMRSPMQKFGDKNATPFFHISRYIDRAEPRCVVLENVEGTRKQFKSPHGAPVGKYKCPHGFHLIW